MIELSEVVTLTRQMKETLIGKEIARVEGEESRPKSLFLTPEPLRFGRASKDAGSSTSLRGASGATPASTTKRRC